MKRLLLLLVLVAGPAGAICINAAGPATADCGADQYSTGGTTWGPLQQLGLPLATLRYGAFSYAIPVDPGVYRVTLTLVEPNATAARQRLFTVALNGQQSDPLDVFALAGGQLMATTKDYFVLASVGMVKLDFKGVVGNALVSRIEVTPVSQVVVTGGIFSVGTGLRLNTALNPPALEVIPSGPPAPMYITMYPVLDGTTYRPQVRGEFAKAVMDGVFTLQNAPTDGSLAVYVNGIRQAFFAVQGVTLKLNALATDEVLCDYFYDKPVN